MHGVAESRARISGPILNRCQRGQQVAARSVRTARYHRAQGHLIQGNGSRKIPQFRRLLRGPLAALNGVLIVNAGGAPAKEMFGNLYPVLTVSTVARLQRLTDLLV